MNRIIYADNTNLNDLSVSLNDYYSGITPFNFDYANDALYFGTTLPFNHFYAEVTTANTTVSSTISMSHWDGDEWKDCVEVLDETSLNGYTFGQSGYITFTSSKNNSWNRDDTDQMTSSVLTTKTIYDLFWTKLEVSADMTAAIKWIGNIFSNDYDLRSEFPDLLRSEVLSTFQTGKTDWKEQHYIAANVIIKDLIAKKVMLDPNQVLAYEDLKSASVQKVAQIIFNALGDDYLDQYKLAEKEYYTRLDKAYVKIDYNQNARVDTVEQRPTFLGMLYR